MFDRIRGYFAPPVFEDEDETRVARLLNVVLLTIFAVALLLTLLSGLLGETSVYSLAIGLTTALLTLAMWFGMKRGHVRPVGVLLASMLLVNVTAGVYFAGTIRAPLVTAYALCILVAGLLISNRAAVVFTALSLLALFGLLQIEVAGLMAPIQAPTGITQWLTYAMTFSVTAVLLTLAIRSINEALERARRDSRALAEGNLELIRREEALQGYAERLRILHEVDQAILEARSPEKIAQVTLHHVRRLVPCRRSSVELFDYEANVSTLLVADANGKTEVKGGTSLSLDSYGVLDDLRQGKPLLVEDLTKVVPLTPVRQTLLSEGVRSFISVPLISRGQLIGALNIGVEHAGGILEEYVDIAKEVAAQLAVAIQDARLLEAERRRSAELEAVRQASLHVTSSLELQPVLEAILDHTLELASADSIHIFLSDGEQLTFGAVTWAEGARQETYAEPRPNGLTCAVASSGERIIAPDVDSHPLFQDRRWGGAVVGLPLRVGEQMCGVMNIAFEKPRTFSESELNVLELLADQAAVAIHNAGLHQQVRRHASELAEALARQEELDRLKGEFIQNVSHELRSPLALIRGYAEMLDSSELGKLHAEQEGPVSVISRRARMLSDLVEDITLIMEAEARPLDLRPVTLDEIARTAVEDFHMAAEEAGLSLKAKIDHPIPPIMGSPTYLRRVLDNLLSNAIKFTPEGGTVTVRVSQGDKSVSLEVRDTGIGIPPDQLERVFERFYQVDGSLQRKYGGVGLGLALVREIVELHGGQVKVESRLDEGSIFAVTFPVTDEEEELREEHPPA
jgi:signal transduction histidine kinase